MTAESITTHEARNLTHSSFRKSIDILLTKPHVVNKRLWGSKILSRNNVKPLNAHNNLPLDIKQLGPENIEEYTADLLTYLQFNKAEDGAIEVLLIELLPKNYCESHAFQLVILNRHDNFVSFYDITPSHKEQKLCPPFKYTLELVMDQVVLRAACEPSSKSYKWLADKVLPQIAKWAEEKQSRDSKKNICNESLSLVCSEKYYKLYNDLKLKYGKEMVKIWPECTDPSKFVYEDVAIATYLLLLWQEERNRRKTQKLQSFVDLGCGNGLLVYILAQEGHPGVGIDVRKRQIWDIYPDNVKLEEKTITPSDLHLFPDTDWLIGNHSDELTPWIPVIAARSSYGCNFFLLPCCAYSFDGTKYQRQNSSKSQYTEYLEHIKQLCEECGFVTKRDRLKIPSTKRICFVSAGRRYAKDEQENYCDKIQGIINSDVGEIPENINQDVWIKDIKTRDQVEKVRNCTQIDKNIIDSIVDCIACYLLHDYDAKASWSLGKIVELSEVVNLIPEEELKSLKSECGGLQTVLKNNHHIFKVQNGKVQLRHPKSIEEVNETIKKKQKCSNIKLQQKPCWFYNNHPQGCPLSDNKCSYLHVKS